VAALHAAELEHFLRIRKQRRELLDAKIVHRIERSAVFLASDAELRGPRPAALESLANPASTKPFDRSNKQVHIPLL
jgi:hypothetical protein